MDTYQDVILNMPAAGIILTSFLAWGAAQHNMSIYNEQRALEGLRKLDSQSIGAIYDHYFPEVYRYVRYRLMMMRS